MYVSGLSSETKEVWLHPHLHYKGRPCLPDQPCMPAHESPQRSLFDQKNCQINVLTLFYFGPHFSVSQLSTACVSTCNDGRSFYARPWRCHSGYTTVSQMFLYNKQWHVVPKPIAVVKNEIKTRQSEHNHWTVEQKWNISRFLVFHKQKLGQIMTWSRFQSKH